MKKIPTLFKRDFTNKKITTLPELSDPSFEWVRNC